MKFLLPLLIGLLISCTQEKLSDEDYYNYDSLIAQNAFDTTYINSLIEKYPNDEYFYSMKLISLALYFSKDFRPFYYNMPQKQQESKLVFRSSLFDFIIEANNMQGKGGGGDLEISTIRFYRKVFVADQKKQDIWIRWLIHYIYKYAKEYKQAFQYLNMALMINPENQFLIKSLVDLKRETGATSDIDDYLEQLDPKFHNFKYPYEIYVIDYYADTTNSTAIEVE